ncbi:MAG: hypothetical protein ACLPLR_10130 [Terriglobales bacterium]
MKRKRIQRYWTGILALGMIGAGLAWAQTQAQPAEQPPAPTAQPAQPVQPAQPATPAVRAYQPKSPNDPARSESEALALGYMRVLLRAEHDYKKRHDKFADTLEALVGTGSFTKRMAETTDRGDYTVGFRARHEGPNHEGFVLTMTPKHMDSEHRSFYAEDNGVIHADDQKAADLDSPKVQ